MAQNDNNDRTEESGWKRLRLDFDFPNDLKPYYIERFNIQHIEGMFYLSFFAVELPPLSGTDEEKMEQLSEIDSIRAKCVARIVMTPAKMEEFMEKCAENYETYRQSLEDEDSS